MSTLGEGTLLEAMAPLPYSGPAEWTERCVWCGGDVTVNVYHRAPVCDRCLAEAERRRKER